MLERDPSLASHPQILHIVFDEGCGQARRTDAGNWTQISEGVDSTCIQPKTNFKPLKLAHNIACYSKSIYIVSFRVSLCLFSLVQPTWVSDGLCNVFCYYRGSTFLTRKMPWKRLPASLLLKRFQWICQAATNYRCHRMSWWRAQTDSLKNGRLLAS